MAVVIESVGPVASGSAQSSATLTFSGTPAGQLLLAVFAFEGVGAGSGPYISSSVGGGWSRTFYQPPAGGSGTGLEVWNTLDWSIFSTNTFNFGASYSYAARGLVYTGQYFDGSTSPVRTVVQQSVTGSPIATPTVTAFTGELLIAVGGFTLAAPGWGTPNPAGAMQRFDSARSGYGTAEATAADYQVAAGGLLGPFTWPATASSGTAHGATGLFAVRPAVAGGTSQAVLDAAMPPDIAVPGGWTFRFTAIDPITGATVPGVTVSEANIVAADISGDGGGGADLGPYMLVPGPDA